METTHNSGTAEPVPDSETVVKSDQQQGNVYFVRHSESTSNERNIFAGLLDVGLTSFGKLQARRAGQDIQKKGVKFDASEDVRKYITDYLVNILDTDKNGTIDLKELENYVSTYGFVVNLNTDAVTI